MLPSCVCTTFGNSFIVVVFMLSVQVGARNTDKWSGSLARQTHSIRAYMHTHVIVSCISAHACCRQPVSHGGLYIMAGSI